MWQAKKLSYYRRRYSMHLLAFLKATQVSNITLYLCCTYDIVLLFSQLIWVAIQSETPP